MNRSELEKTIRLLANHALSNQLPPLNGDFHKGAHLALPYFTRDMGLTKRYFLFRFAAMYGENHIERMSAVLRECPTALLSNYSLFIFDDDPPEIQIELLQWALSSEAVTEDNLLFCEELLEEESADSRKAILNTVATVNDTDRGEFVSLMRIERVKPLLSDFATAPKRNWEPALSFADELSCRGPSFHDWAKKLVHLPDLSDLIKSYRYLKSNLYLAPIDEGLEEFINTIQEFSQQEKSFLPLLQGFGTLEDKRNCLHALCQLQNGEDSCKLQILKEIISSHTPVILITDLIKQLQAKKFGIHTIIRNFLYEALAAHPSDSITIKPNESCLGQLMRAIYKNPGADLHFYSDESQTNEVTAQFFRKAIKEIPSRFAALLEQNSEGHYIIRSIEEPSILIIGLAKQLGAILRMMPQKKIQLPETFPLSKEFFTQLREESAQMHIQEVADAFTAGSLFRPSDLCFEALCPQLPPTPKVRPPLDKNPLSSAAINTILEQADTFSEHSKQQLLMLFKDDADVSVPMIEAFTGYEELFDHCLPLFNSSDSAEMKFQLMDHCKDRKIPPKQIEKASRLVLEGDTISRRQEILNAVNKYYLKRVPETPLPLLNSDSGDDRLTLAELVVANELQEAAAKTPLFPNTDTSARFARIQWMAAIGTLKLEAIEESRLLMHLQEWKQEEVSGLARCLASVDQSIVRQLVYLDADEFLSISVLIVKLGYSSNDLPYFLKPILDNRDFTAIKLTLETFPEGIDLQYLKLLFDLFTETAHKKILQQHLFAIEEREQLTEVIALLAKMAENEREALLELVKELPTEGMFLGTFSQLPIEERAEASKILNEFFITFDDPDESSQVCEELGWAIQESHSAQQLLSGTLAWISSRLEEGYSDFPVEKVTIDEKNPILPQLYSYLQSGELKRLFIYRPHSPAIDAGGPSREVLEKARLEMADFYSDVIVQNDEGSYSFNVDSYNPQKAHAFGKHLFLCIYLGIPLPEGIVFEAGQLETLSSIALNCPDSLEFDSLADYLVDCSIDIEDLQNLYKQIHKYDLEKYPDYQPNCLKSVGRNMSSSEGQEILEELRDSLKIHQTRFMVVKALTHGGSINLSPIYFRLIMALSNLSERLCSREGWDFSELKGNSMLQEEYFLRWARESSQEQLTLLVRSATGLPYLAPGKRIAVANVQIEGIGTHYCFNKLDIPFIPRDDELEQAEADYLQERANLLAEGRSLQYLDSYDRNYIDLKEFIKRCFRYKDYEEWKKLLDYIPLGDTHV